jgi:hypothetical protein
MDDERVDRDDRGVKLTNPAAFRSGLGGLLLVIALAAVFIVGYSHEFNARERIYAHVTIAAVSLGTYVIAIWLRKKEFSTT